jgi:hypothetical protein
MYHLELRQFPHNVCRFNLSEGELRVVVEPWVRDKVVDFGERKWMPHQARLTILEGPQLSVQELSMGRGWRAAQRQGQNVTERLLTAAREAAEGAAAAQAAAAVQAAAEQLAATGAPARADPLADPLGVGVQIAALLGAEPAQLLDAWRAAAAGNPGLAPSQSLALAERTLGKSPV